MASFYTSDDLPPRCDGAELACVHAVRALPATELAAAEAHLASCAVCRRELDSLRPVLDGLAFWPTDVLRPAESLHARLSRQITGETGDKPELPEAIEWRDPEWEQVVPGVECKLLATDAERDRVSMLVRLSPGATYPAHTHAGEEELHLLHGELWIDGRKLLPGDYNHGAPGEDDDRVWSETGCTCFLVTSTRDVLR